MIPARKKVSSHRYCPLEKNDRLNNRYIISKYLGKGRFCSVFAARDKHNNSVAVKVYRAGNSNTAYFDTEVNILTHIPQNTHIIKMHDTFAHLSYDPEDAKSTLHACIVVDRLEQTVYDLLANANNQGLPSNKVIHLTRQILAAIDVVHKANVVMGDLSPSNIMVNADGTVVLNDFNSAEFSHKIKPSTLGTQEYSSPEIILHQKYNYAADIWSIGCIVFELATGGQLFAIDDDGSDEEGSVYDIRHDDDDETDTDGEYDYDYSYSSDDGDETRHEINYHHFSLMWQLLGKPPRQVIEGGRPGYFNAKGKLKFNPDLESINLTNLLQENFGFNKRRANIFSKFIFSMIKYLPSERQSAERLLSHSFFKQF